MLRIVGKLFRLKRHPFQTSERPPILIYQTFTARENGSEVESSQGERDTRSAAEPAHPADRFAREILAILGCYTRARGS